MDRLGIDTPHTLQFKCFYEHEQLIRNVPKIFQSPAHLLAGDFVVCNTLQTTRNSKQTQRNGPHVFVGVLAIYK